MVETACSQARTTAADAVRPLLRGLLLAWAAAGPAGLVVTAWWRPMAGADLAGNVAAFLVGAGLGARACRRLP